MPQTKEGEMSNKGLLTLIVVLLLGILTIMIVQMNDRSPAEQISDSVSESVENISNTLEENMDS